MDIKGLEGLLFTRAKRLADRLEKQAATIRDAVARRDVIALEGVQDLRIDNTHTISAMAEVIGMMKR